MLRVRTLITGVAGAPWYVNMYHDGATEENAQEAVDNTVAFWTGMAGNMTNGLQIQTQGEVANVSPSTGDVLGVFAVDTSVVVGTEAQFALPHALQGLLRLSTGFYQDGRQVKGRIFLPGLNSTAQAADGSVAPAEGAAWVAAAGNLTPTLGVWSRPKAATDSGPARAGSFVSPVTVAYWNQFAVLRSRRD